ncbi:MAG: FxLYD domain-containing protein, partial [Desulfovibrio sp.]|nr:FxLYD domain-containing protein [Desulfovibrio sp.]
MLALCVLQLVVAHAANARLIDLDPDYFGEREFGVSEQGMFEGVILNVSQHVLAGVQVDITALDKDGAQLWRRTIALPPLKPTQRAPVSAFVGLDAGQPATYDTMYRMDDTVGKNPNVTTATERREVGFSVKGTGDFRTSPVTISSGEKTFTIEYLGDDVVVVLLQNAAGTLELPLFELQGPGNATTRIVLDAKDAYAFHVDGDGAWTIQLRDDQRA